MILTHLWANLSCMKWNCTLLFVMITIFAFRIIKEIWHCFMSFIVYQCVQHSQRGGISLCLWLYTLVFSIPKDMVFYSSYCVPVVVKISVFSILKEEDTALFLLVWHGGYLTLIQCHMNILMYLNELEFTVNLIVYNCVGTL
jgi:hypothetical protein